MHLLIMAGVVLGGLALFWVGSRRFARRRTTEGAWNARGPIHPTRPPRNWRRNRFGNGLAFDLQHGLDRDDDWPNGRKPGSPDSPAT